MRRLFIVVDIQLNVSEASQMITYPQKLGLVTDSRKRFLSR